MKSIPAGVRDGHPLQCVLGILDGRESSLDGARALMGNLGGVRARGHSLGDARVPLHNPGGGHAHVSDRDVHVRAPGHDIQRSGSHVNEHIRQVEGDTGDVLTVGEDGFQ